MESDDPSPNKQQFLVNFAGIHHLSGRKNVFLERRGIKCIKFTKIIVMNC